jgi:hypothetical protein
MGKYMPRLTMFRRPSKLGTVYQLAIEFSAPKLIFGNNFDELSDVDFEQVLTALQQALFELLNHRFFKQQLAQAEVGAIHPSKNIVFLDYTASQTVLSAIAKLDISRVYDVQKTDFRDGHVVHIHCNSLDIALYDKMADLRRSKISQKRAVEKDSIIQLSLLDNLEDYRPIEVFRYEVRINGKAAIKRAYSELDSWTFEVLFKQKLCQAVLLKHWQQITKSVDLLALDVNKPYELLQNYLSENPHLKPRTALAAVAGLLIGSQEGAGALRNTIEAHFGQAAWYSLKPLLNSPKPNRYMYFTRIEEVLERFQPVRFVDYKTNIENSSK